MISRCGSNLGWMYAANTTTAATEPARKNIDKPNKPNVDDKP